MLKILFWCGFLYYCLQSVHKQPIVIVCPPSFESCCVPEDYQQLIEDIVRDGRLYASENHQEILKVLNDYQHDCASSERITFHPLTRLVKWCDTFVPPTGQEADKGAVWCTGPSSELLQVHCTGVQRDVSTLLHQAAALQSHQVSTAIQIERGLLTVWLKSPMILYHSKSSSQNTSLPICSFLPCINSSIYMLWLTIQIPSFCHTMSFLIFDPF